MLMRYLPVNQQYIIYGLNSCERKTRKLIAQDLGISERTIYTQEQSALNRLRKFEKIKALGKK